MSRDHELSLPSGLIHHSARGSQYCSIDYQAVLRKHDLLISMSGKGNHAIDNAVVDRPFFKTIKSELISAGRLADPLPGRERRWLDTSTGSTIRSGGKSTLGYQSPVQFEMAGRAVSNKLSTKPGGKSTVRRMDRGVRLRAPHRSALRVDTPRPTTSTSLEMNGDSYRLQPEPQASKPRLLTEPTTRAHASPPWACTGPSRLRAAASACSQGTPRRAPSRPPVDYGDTAREPPSRSLLTPPRWSLFAPPSGTVCTVLPFVRG